MKDTEKNIILPMTLKRSIGRKQIVSLWD